MGRGRIAPVIQATPREPVSVADGRVENHFEEVGQVGGTAGIHGINLQVF